MEEPKNKQPKGTVSVAEAGRRGGNRTKELHSEQFSVMGKKGGKRLLEKYGIDYFKRIGKKGGNPEAYKEAVKLAGGKAGPEYFAEMAEKSGLEYEPEEE